MTPSPAVSEAATGPSNASRDRGALAGRVVIVTGAARGLGRAYTLELCRQGAAVVATDVDEAALEEVADAVRDRPGSVHAQACDITDPDAPRLLLHVALGRYGQLHAWCPTLACCVPGRSSSWTTMTSGCSSTST